MEKIKKLLSMIDECNNIVAFTGAGISTDSGLKDFRGKNGLYKEKTLYPAEYMLSNNCFYTNTKVFYDYYKENFNCLKIKPNINHKMLKKLEDIGKLKAIITQNIDGLHTKAGSKTVYEIHGTIFKNYCIKCHKEYDAKYVFESNGIPKCTCGGLIKPKVTLYGESLPEDEFSNGIKAIAKADMLVVAGSSLTVFPASSMIDYFRGKYLVILNEDNTPYDHIASLVINDELKKVSTEILKKYK